MVAWWRYRGGWKAEGKVWGFVVVGFKAVRFLVFCYEREEDGWSGLAWVLRWLGCIPGCWEERMGGGERGQRGSAGLVRSVFLCLSFFSPVSCLSVESLPSPLVREE